MMLCRRSLSMGAHGGADNQDQLRQVNSQWEAEMVRLVEQLDVAQQQLKEQLAGPGGVGDPAEVERLKKQLADEAEDNDALSEQLVVLDSDHQKLQEKNETLSKENEVFRKENERLLKLNAAVSEPTCLPSRGPRVELCTVRPSVPWYLVLLTDSVWHGMWSAGGSREHCGRWIQRRRTGRDGTRKAARGCWSSSRGAG